MNIPVKTITFLCLLALFACKQKNTEDNSEKIEVGLLEDSDEEVSSDLENEVVPTKYEVDFEKHKNLLNLILLLPDSCFSSWGWSLADRKLWYNEIQTNNFYLDYDPIYFTLITLKQHFAHFTIIDGSWKIALYPISKNSFIVLTNDIVGDGNDICTFEVKNNTLSYFRIEEINFENYISKLIRTDLPEDCLEKTNEIEKNWFSFDLSGKNKIEIESSWVLRKNKYDDCLLGNALVYTFNAQTKKFELEKIYWKQPTEY